MTMPLSRVPPQRQAATVARPPARLGGRIKQSSVDEVKAAADMVAVVSAVTPLRRAGARWSGRCPFHEERTPSFSVNAQDKLFYCFGCGKGGDLVSFVMETERVDFAGAIEALAGRFNVPLEYEEASPHVEQQRRRRDRLLSLLDRAASFYERYLWDSPAGGQARDYLAGRGLREEVCREYRLGLALGGTTLARRALADGFSREELSAAGLLGRQGSDYFQRRLLFPLADARGRVRGFQARKLREDDPLKAKYVNSPEGELFRKGDLLYGLDRARAVIAKQDRAVIVEGNTDVLALRQAGVEPVVASMGTALTDRQLRELGRLTKRLWLCFDGDAAGEAATLRGMELAADQGFVVRVVTLPPGLDPADVAEGFETFVQGAVTYARHRAKVILDQPLTKDEKLGLIRELAQRFDRSSLDWLDAIQYAADRLSIPREVVASVPSRADRRPEVSVSSVGGSADRLERDALAGVVAHPQLAEILGELDPELFGSELYRRLRLYLLGEAPPDDDLVGARAELDARAAVEDIDEETARQALLRLRERWLRRAVASAEGERLLDLQHQLEGVREAFRQLA